jgi:gluconolactonase
MTGYEPGVDEWYAAREESLIMSADLSMILESPTVERVATDFVFTEGPLWHPDGFLLFVDIRRSLLLRWQPGEGVAIVRETTGEGNGVTFDRQGCLIMCEGGKRRLSRTEADGRVVTLAVRVKVPGITAR